MVFIPKSSSEFEMNMFLSWFKSLKEEKIIHIIDNGSGLKGAIHEGLVYVPLPYVKALHKSNYLKFQDMSEL